MSKNRRSLHAKAISALIAAVTLGSWAKTLFADEGIAGLHRTRATAEPFERIGQVPGRPFNLLRNQGATFTSDSHSFVTKNLDHVRLWDARTLKPLTQPLAPPDLDNYSISSDGGSLFTTSYGEVRLWDVATSKPRAVILAAKKSLRFFDAGANMQFITIARENAAAMVVWSASADKVTELYHQRYGNPLDSAQFDPTGTYIVNKEFGGPFHLLNADSGRDICTPLQSDYDPPSSARYLAQFDPAGTRLAIPLNQGFKILQSSSGKVLAEVHWEGDFRTQAIHFSADGSLVIVTTMHVRQLEQGPVFIFDAITGKRTREFGSRIFTCQIAPGNRWALCNNVGHNYAKPELWDLQKGVQVQTFPPPNDVNHVALMSPDGQTILIGSGPETISVWRHAHPDAPTTRTE